MTSQAIAEILFMEQLGEIGQCQQRPDAIRHRYAGDIQPSEVKLLTTPA
jgi:hypothetical protein